MKSFRHLGYSPMAWVKTCCLITGVVLLQGCDPKPEKPIENKVVENKNISPETSNIFKSHVVHVNVGLPNCNESHCPQIQIQRLQSDDAAIDQLIDQYILNYIKHLVQNFDLREQPTAQHPIGAADTSNAQKNANMHDVKKDAVAQLSTHQILAQQLQADIDKFVQLSDEVRALGSSAQQTLYIKPQVLNPKGPIVTIIINASNYMGGAHGSTAQQYINFELEKKRVLHLKKMIKQGQQKAFDALVHQKFQLWIKDLQPDIDLNVYENLWPFKVSENFYLSQKGLILQYGEYEIGPYALGLPRLEIPYDELQNILDAQYLPTNLQTSQNSATKTAAVAEAQSKEQPKS